MKDFFILLVQTVFLEFIIVFGAFFFFGYLLHLLAKKTNANYTNSIGWRGIYITAWLGTPIHELGHVFFAKLFRHDISEISLFRPNKETGGLGHVAHSFNKRSLFQQSGRFFIGAAPLLFGIIILIMLLLIMVPNGQEILTKLLILDFTFFSSIQGIISALSLLFTTSNFTSPTFWIFIYISFCIASHMAPSKQDRKGMWKGLSYIIILISLLTAILLLIGIDVLSIAKSMQKLSTIFTGIFLYTIFLSAMHLLISYILLVIPNRIFRGIHR